MAFTLSSVDAERFLARTAETVATCNFRLLGSRGAPLRSDYLRPQSFAYTHISGGPQARAELRTHMVDALAAKRSDAMPRPPFKPPLEVRWSPALVEAIRRGALGTVLLFDPDYNLVDGAAVEASEGFFDDNNEPPWDTWLWYASTVSPQTAQFEYMATCLVSWVPTDLLERAKRGIYVNPEQCIVLARDIDTPVSRELRRLGLL